MAVCITCGEEYNDKRAALGYKKCLECGDGKKEFTVVPMHKSNYVVVSSKADVKHTTGQELKHGQF